jgi:probable F420-dependent oxidoreductase
MRFGLSLPHYGFSLPSGEIAFADAAGWARRAEALGFDSVWVSDHFFYSFARYGADPSPIASLEPLTTLAGVAVATERVRLGTLVLCASFRHPALLARAAASIDLLSKGRLELGLGAGWLEEEFEAFGYRFGSVGERFIALEGSLEVLHALFSGDPVTLDRPGVMLRDATLRPEPERRPPLWVGGKGGPRLLGLAARHADGWNVVWRMSPVAYAEKLKDVRNACDAAGRDPETLALAVGLYSLIGEDEGAARAAFPPPPPPPRPRERDGGRRCRDVAGRHAVRDAGADPRPRRGLRGARCSGADRGPVGPAVRDPRARAGGAVRRAGDPAPPRRLMEPREAVLTILREEGARLHWTKIQDLALRRGYLDPFEHPGVRREVQTALQELVREGLVVKEAKGVYGVAARADGEG